MQVTLVFNKSPLNLTEPSKPVVQIVDDPKNIETQDLSPVTLTTGDNVTALTNTSITIQCPTTGIPKPTVTWTKDDQQLLSGGRYTIQDDGSLMISEADKEDTARYTCIADSVAGKDSASSVVQVVGKWCCNKYMCTCLLAIAFSGTKTLKGDFMGLERLLITPKSLQGVNV